MQPGNLIEHPEGGRYREVFRSPHTITPPSRGPRSALTHIYFSLNADEVSRFHKVRSDEVWNLYRGEGLRLFLWDDDSAQLEIVELRAETATYCHVVPAGCWQAATPLSDAVLVGCSVAPGFDFADFELLQMGSATAQRLLAGNPEVARLIARGTN